MGSINAKVKVDFKVIELRKAILTDMCSQLDAVLQKNKYPIREEIRRYVRRAILSHATAHALHDGQQLAFDLGIPLGDGTITVVQIADMVAKSMSIGFSKIKPRGKQIGGGIKFGIIVSDYSDVMGIYNTNIITDKGFKFNWLGWLLKEGKEFIIKTHHVKYTTGHGRSGGAIMVKKGMWRVPDPHSGTENDNWFTRCFVKDKDNFTPEFEQFLEDLLGRYF